MNFALYRRPAGVVFLDDDPDYLEMLSDVLPQNWPLSLFMDPRVFVNHLQQEPPLWEADIWRHQEIVERWHEGQPVIPQVLAYWASSPARHALNAVCVVDYSMPGMNGLEALSELVDWPGARVLLTGRADEHIAVDAFNRGLIEQYIPKQIADLSRRLGEIVQRLIDRADSRHAAIWRGTLTPHQHALLRVPSVGRALAEISRKAGWVEHVVMGAPFGVLGLDERGQASWLQLETTDGVGALAELAHTQGVSRADVQAIRSASKLIDLELRLALDVPGPPRLMDAFGVGETGQLHGALFGIDSRRQPGEAAGFVSFMRSFGPRQIRH